MVWEFLGREREGKEGGWREGGLHELLSECVRRWLDQLGLIVRPRERNLKWDEFQCLEEVFNGDCGAL